MGALTFFWYFLNYKCILRFISMSQNSKSLFDKFAIWLSAVCIVHCLTIPLLIAFLPIATLGFSSDQHFHEVIFWFVFPISSVGLVAGVREHQEFKPVFLGLLALAMLSYLIYLHQILSLEIEFIFSIIACLLLAYAHWLNLKLVKKFHVHKRPSHTHSCDHDHHH